MLFILIFSILWHMTIGSDKLNSVLTITENDKTFTNQTKRLTQNLERELQEYEPTKILKKKTSLLTQTLVTKDMARITILSYLSVNEVLKFSQVCKNTRENCVYFENGFL